jgi:hypothetical protein
MWLRSFPITVSSNGRRELPTGRRGVRGSHASDPRSIDVRAEKFVNPGVVGQNVEAAEALQWSHRTDALCPASLQGRNEVRLASPSPVTT